ncbi:MAG TPA: TIR domain-containing protein, partial [Sphingomicrobium sp.]|nr:TIR domain-containing protein [Sphingomicrobium sp.]
MSRVFVSYSRQDAPRAKALAKALQAAGHEVWWDSHIRGGSRFGAEIAEALKNAEVVVVLWSRSSIESAWVNDEAAEGRDTGRLVPILIDDCKPPLGFRQFQAIDLKAWTGRRTLPPAVLDAIAARTAEGPIPPSRPGAEDRSWWKLGRGPQIALLALGVLIAGAWAYFERMGSRDSAVPTLAVLPFADLSPNRDKGYFAEGVAESILSLLGREPGIRVIGRTSASLFKDRGSDLAAMRKSLGVTHVLEGSARTAGDDLRLSVRLVDAADGTQLWAQDYQRKLRNVFAVQDEIGRSVATELLGTLSTGRAPAPITRADAYDLYLATRATMRNRREPVLRKALAMAQRVIAADPSYAPGHAILAELVWLLSDDAYSYGNIPHRKARSVAIRHARKAIELAPGSAEGYAALGLVLPPEQGVEPLRQAIRLDPVRAELRAWLALHLATLGRTAEAIKEVEAGAEIDPLSTVPINRLHGILVASGEFERAENIVRQYVARGGEPAQAARFRTVQARVSGDLSQAVGQARLAMSLNPDVPYVRQFLEGLAATLGMPALVTWPPERNRRFIWLLARGDKARLLLEARSANSTVWTKPDAATAFLALAEARDWPQIARLYAARGAAASALCKERTGAIVATAMALERIGRKDQSVRLLACLDREIRMQARGPNGPDLTNRNEHEFAKAQLAALRGNDQAALNALETAVQLGWRGYPYSARLSSYPALERLQSNLGYARVQKRLDQLIAAERSQVASAQGPRASAR